MIEMIETAGILEKATESSLIIMDEIGRGTATYDGLSIAWATLEHLHNEIRCRTLFATHYHELTQLENAFQNIKNAKVAIREWNDEIIFLHEVKFGTADKSYGIQVAKIAGLPKSVTKRANVILEKLEGITNKVEISTITNKVKPENDNLTFNNANDEYLKKKTEESLKVFDMLSKLDTDDITPKEAFKILNDTVLSIRSIN
jgi:DNA mismatch repair protein MutS